MLYISMYVRMFAWCMCSSFCKSTYDSYKLQFCSFEERLVAQRKEREMAEAEAAKLGFKKPLSKEEKIEKKKQRLAAIGNTLLPPSFAVRRGSLHCEFNSHIETLCSLENQNHGRGSSSLLWMMMGMFMVEEKSHVGLSNLCLDKHIQCNERNLDQWIIKNPFKCGKHRNVNWQGKVESGRLINQLDRLKN